MKELGKLPSHLLRNKCFECLIRNWRRGKFLEIGSGTGKATKIFLQRNFSGVCYDISDESRKVLSENLKEFNDKVRIIDDLLVLEKGSFDYLFIFDVLEHIEDDLGAFKIWTSYLKSNGKALISVPAHIKRYDKSDELMGHLRRYEKKALFDLLKKAGYEKIEIVNYGYPLLNLTSIFINAIYKMFPNGNIEYDNLSPEERTGKSGVKSPDIVNRLSFLFNGFTVFFFMLCQKIFFKKDIGVAYIAYAEKVIS